MRVLLKNHSIHSVGYLAVTYWHLCLSARYKPLSVLAQMSLLVMIICVCVCVCVCVSEYHGKSSTASVIVDEKISDVQYRRVSVITGHSICS